uniref:ribosomal protein S4 n=1 Tax=Tetraselmis marina TaxID=41888 RepID=UPI0021820C67|nr:ribosomal protein S4 [Tetraselmis marina]UVF37906.1 ribosomal protein S4 [Tetraselmis marina]
MRFLLNIRKRKKKSEKKYDPKNAFFSYSAYLNEKRRLMSFYQNSFSTRWLKRYCRQSYKFLGQPLGNILFLIERRLDVSLYRIKFCKSVLQARQLIGHGKILMNNVPIFSPSYQLKAGDVLKMKKINNVGPWPGNGFTILKKSAQKKMRFLDPIAHKRRRQQLLRNKINKQISNREKKPGFLFRPLNFEVNYILRTAIFLFSPQILYYEDKIRLDFIRRRLKS